MLHGPAGDAEGSLYFNGFSVRARYTILSSARFCPAELNAL
jgi:hypothetical protein